jgi:cell division protein FtsI/penicillin-binding protein 2
VYDFGYSQSDKRSADMLSKELELDREDVLKKVEKVSSMEKIKTNVDKKTGDRIREYNLPGVKVDEDFKRYYPYDRLASIVRENLNMEAVYKIIEKGNEASCSLLSE